MPPDEAEQPGEAKRRLRAAMLARRDGLGEGERAAASAAISAAVLSMRALFVPGPVSIFWPIRTEVDTRPLIGRLAELGYDTCLPIVDGEHLIFRAWQPGQPMQAAGFGLREPTPMAPERQPATLLVPLSAFDRRAHRLGYGRGFYDRALTVLAGQGPVRSIGLAFAVQETERVPTEPHDQALDYIVTERAIIAGQAGPRAG
jgi:5-formyltetrahydrofolate cyclo-ligase